MPPQIQYFRQQSIASSSAADGESEVAIAQVSVEPMDAAQNILLAETFRKVGQLYPDTLSLQQARSKSEERLSALEMQIASIEARFRERNRIQEKVEHALRELFDCVQNEEFINETQDVAGNLIGTVGIDYRMAASMANICDESNTTSGFARTTARLGELRMELEKTKLVHMIIKSALHFSNIDGIERLIGKPAPEDSATAPTIWITNWEDGKHAEEDNGDDVDTGVEDDFPY